MKVGLISPPHRMTGGGGYTYVTMIYEALKNFDLGQDVVLLDYEEIENTPNTAIPDSDPLERSLFDRVNVAFTRSLNYHIRKNGIDFLWMITESTTYVPCVPFMLTVWDLAHRHYPFFPEVSMSGWTWGERENFYTTILPRASYILTGTDRGAYEIMSCYGIPSERIRVNPFPAPPMVKSVGRPPFPNGRYLLYPAQFWPHKNHVRAIKALRLLREDSDYPLDLVLVGADHGNERHVRRVAEEEGMTDYVHFAGFVDLEVLSQLYRNAEALLYLSFFGPDNLPPLEALSYECPVIVSDHPGHREQLSGAAVFVDPLDEHAIADGVKRLCTDPDLRDRLKREGLALIQKRTVEAYLTKVRDILSEFALYQACWTMPSSAFANITGYAPNPTAPPLRYEGLDEQEGPFPAINIHRAFRWQIRSCSVTRIDSRVAGETVLRIELAAIAENVQIEVRLNGESLGRATIGPPGWNHVHVLSMTVTAAQGINVVEIEADPPTVTEDRSLYIALYKVELGPQPDLLPIQGDANIVPITLNLGDDGSGLPGQIMDETRLTTDGAIKRQPADEGLDGPEGPFPEINIHRPFRWQVQPRSAFRLENGIGGEMMLNIELALPAITAQIEVVLNGASLGRATIGPGGWDNLHVCQMIVKAAPGTNVVEIEAGPPTVTENRSLYIAIYRVELGPVDKTSISPGGAQIIPIWLDPVDAA